MVAIDATRGCAMLAVCLSHFGQIYAQRNPRAADVAQMIGMFATPTFLLLSGLLVGLLGVGRTNDHGRYRRRLLDRGIFLLLVAHVLIGMSMVGHADLTDSIFGSFYITDSIGVALCIASLVVGRAGAATLLTAGVALFLGSWTATFLLPSAGGPLGLAEFVLLGKRTATSSYTGWVVPLLPYTGVFFVGLALSSVLERDDWRLTAASERNLVRLGVCGVAIALCVKFGYLASRSTLPLAVGEFARQSASFFQKLPPGPTYLSFLGGASLLAVALANRTSVQRGGPSMLARAACVAGRSSLFVFILQYWLYYVLPSVVDVPSLPYSPAWFVASVMLLWLAALAWDRHRGNRYFTVGLRA